MSCAVCSNPGDKLCGGCMCINYCSKQCLVYDWKNGHKYTCATLPKKMNNIRLRYGDTFGLADKSDKNDKSDKKQSPGFISVGDNITSVLSKYSGQIIELNSSTLLQLFAYCEIPDSNTASIPVVLGSGILYAAAIINRIKNREKNKFYVFRPKSMFVTSIAVKYGCEPIWLYGPDNNNMFVSITKNTINPIKKPIQFWRNEYITNLLCKITELGDNSTELSVLYKMHSFDDLDIISVCDI
jgi:hypothetical protein